MITESQYKKYVSIVDKLCLKENLTIQEEFELDRLSCLIEEFEKFYCGDDFTEEGEFDE